MKTTTLEGRGFVTAVIRSIGARHDGAHDLVNDGLYVDLRRALRNPADDPTMRYRTGLDDDVYEHVLNTPGARDLINRTAVQLHVLVDEVPVGHVARLTMACEGGRSPFSRSGRSGRPPGLGGNGRRVRSGDRAPPHRPTRPALLHPGPTARTPKAGPGGAHRAESTRWALPGAASDTPGR
ncbi:hypothetical protein LRE75_01480 [Streptomyces sp. 372A]|uniref:RapZ C-terminal domain-containing protein n=1 Tax=Streptomyces sp. SAS_281 TaxID=3412744 RepID=UPI00403D202D